MQTNLAQARRNYYGGGGADDAPRIDGRVKRKTMMGGANQGPISMRLNRSETMENEAEAIRAQRIAKGEARARAQAAQTSRPGNGYDVPVSGAAKPSGMLIPGSAPGSSIWVKNDDPRLKKPTSNTAKPSTPEELAIIAARKKKGQDGMAFSRRRIELERSVAKSTGGKGQMNWRMPSQQNKVGEMAELRDSGRDIWFGDEKF